MKYVRTKDGIYQIKDTKIYRDILKKSFYEAINNEHIYLEEIDKESDIIKELCDRFVVYNKDLDYYAVFDYYDEAFSNVDALEYECKLLGVLETDKGLIYVAKMNDKGELELL